MALVSFPTLAPPISRDQLREMLLSRIRYGLAQVPARGMSARLILRPLSQTVRDLLVDRMLETEARYRSERAKRVYYLSMEFLVGRCLGDAMTNLRIREDCRAILAELEIDLDAVLDHETDAGLGNGGLGRLAACLLESMATVGIAGFGYGIDYDYGLFKQEIVDGQQREKPDRWKEAGDGLLLDRSDQPYLIPVYGRVEDSGARRVWVDYNGIIGLPRDLPVAGYSGTVVNAIRLFSARSTDDFDLDCFNQGDYVRAVEKRIAHENISRVLYPSDAATAGKELRLLQEYFLVACAVRDAMRRFVLDGHKWEELPSQVAMQMNDTHPSLAVVELMRVLVDGCEMEWSKAWEITQATLGYTNHTLLPEALERWPVPLMERVLPRHMEIIYHLNHDLMVQVGRSFPDDFDRMRRMSLIEEAPEKQVRMAHLATLGSHAVNGVSEMHSRLLKDTILRDFHELWPERFGNKTNGVAPRRWLLEANPGLADLLTGCVGEGWITDLQHLRGIEEFVDVPAFQSDFLEVKRHNKRKLARVIAGSTGIVVDPESIFDVQVKRIHEYKRQLLNVMRIVHEYLRLAEDGAEVLAPRTYIFAGKAAPGYWAAKQIIKLIHSVGRVVNTDPRVRERMKVVFLPDYRVSLAEVIMPAADLSEQISTAGMEASGTGNMKLAMNGALTIGTWDGANLEVSEEVGAENIFMFGHTAEELEQMRRSGTYSPRTLCDADPRLRRVLEALASDRFCGENPGLFGWINYAIVDQGDRYFHLADLASYLDISARAEADFVNPPLWARKAILNVARIGKFSSDRTVREYARDIWNAHQEPAAKAVARAPLSA